MLKMQTLFAECHKDSRLSYSLEIPIAQFSPDEYEVLVRDPDGTVRQQAVGGGCIRISRSDAPGVWRFTAEVRSCKDPNDVVDTITAEAVIFPRTEPAVQSAVTETIASVGARTNCGYLYGSSEDFDVSGKAAKLSRQFGETACLELLRRLGLEPPDQTGVLRSLLLVKAGLAPSTARGLLPFAIPVLTELVAGALPAITDRCILPLLKEMPLPSQAKCIYLMRVVSEIGGDNLGPAIDLLREATPTQYRESAAALVLEVCRSEARGRSQAVRLLAEFEYTAAKDTVLEWIQNRNLDASTYACRLMRKADYRRVIPVLRSLLEDDDQWHWQNESAIKLLAEWGDSASVPLLLRKLATAEAGSTEKLVQAILSFGTEFRPKIESVAKSVSTDRARRIAAALGTV